MKTYAFTCGDINGIGPEVVLRTLAKYHRPKVNKLIAFFPINVFETTMKELTLQLDYEVTNKLTEENLESPYITVVNLGKVKQSLGKFSVGSGKTSYKSIMGALELVKSGKADALITAPISKESLNKAGIDFPGHTELLASAVKVKNPMMMFLSKNFKVALFTIHVPLAKVSSKIKDNALKNAIELLNTTLKTDFDIPFPRIAVLGLNPHAGENGLIGTEEKDIIAPVIKSLKDINVTGPYVADAFFGRMMFSQFHAVIGMYHDQLLIPFKMMHFNSGVNYTAGLPIVRTSPDHGTAFDIAGKYVADPTSMWKSFEWARRIVKHRALIAKQNL